MSHRNSEEEFKNLTTGFFQGKITRRRFIRRAAQFGFSAALLSRMVPDSFAANDNLLDSSPLALNESPVTKERVEYLKSKPYRSEEHTSELQSHSDLVCRLLLEKKKKKNSKY